MSRAYEFRVYTLATAEAQHAYGAQYYPRHRESLQRLFGVTVHGYWNAVGGEGFRFSVLMSYPEGADPDAVRQAFRVHPEAAAAMAGFDPSVIRGVSITMLSPAAASPLQ